MKKRKPLGLGIDNFKKIINENYYYFDKTKIIEELGLDRFMLHLPIGSIPHEDVLKSIELYGTKVAPIVREYFRNKG